MTSTVNPDEKKKARLEARISQQQKELIKSAAEISGCSLTDFVVNTVIHAAQQTIREQQMLQLSRKDRLFFVETILNPPSPTEKLKTSAQKYRQHQGQ
jgi:uncharacterized protein (DUF1778 family)